MAPSGGGHSEWQRTTGDLPGALPMSRFSGLEGWAGTRVRGRGQTWAGLWRLCARGGAGGAARRRRRAQAARGPPARGPPARLRGPLRSRRVPRCGPPPPPPDPASLRPRDGRARLGLAPGPGWAAAPAAAAARAAGSGRAGGAGPRRRREEQLPPHRQHLLAERRQPVRRGQRARCSEAADQADGEVRAWRGRVSGDAVEGVGRDLGCPWTGRLQHVTVPEPRLGGQQPRPRPGPGRPPDAGLLVPVADLGLRLQRPAPAVRPLLLGGARGAVLHVLRVRPAQVRGRARGRRAAPVLRGGRLLPDGARGRLLAQPPRRPRRGGEAGAAGRPGAAAQHPPQPRAREPGRRRQQVTTSRPAGARRPGARALAPQTAEEEEEEASQPQTVSIKVPEPGGGAR